MSGSPSESDAEDPATAQEVLRQSQSVINAQIDVSKVLDSKLTSILQASLNLCVASLGAAAFGWSANSWLPRWAAFGLAAMGVCFGTAAFLAIWGLRTSYIGASATSPASLLAAGVHRFPARQAYLAIAFELQKTIEHNHRAAIISARRLNRTLYAAVVAPLVGIAVAVSAAALSGLLL